MSQPPDFADWPLRARASWIVLELSRREMIELLARELEYQYETDAPPGNERVDTELLALAVAALEVYQ